MKCTIHYLLKKNRMKKDKKVVIVDFGMGNLNSVKRKLHFLNIDALVSADSKDIEAADKLILPGVGHFSNAMDNLKELGLIEILNKKVLEDRVPILGICLGMQLMATKSEEGNYEGLGWFDAEVVKFSVKDKLKSIRHHVDYELNPLSTEKLETMIKDKKLVYNYNVDQRAENKFSENEILENLDFNRLPRYLIENKNKYLKWLS